MRQKIFINLFLLLQIFFLANTEARNTVIKENIDECFPPSKLRFSKNLKSTTGLNEFEFNQLIDRVNRVMAPVIQKQTKKQVVFERNWNDDEVNAHATRDDEDNLVVMLTGGLARHPLMTKDAFLLIACHEIGHFLGGAPKQFRGNTQQRTWSSAEGQADYFAATKCLPLLFQDKTETKSLDLSLNPEVKRKAFTRCDNDVCARVVVAGWQISSVFASLKEGTIKPDITKNDPTLVDVTFMKHPNPQCRLDTFVMGANCDAPTDEAFSDFDPKVGACLYAKKNARPACWYKDE